MGNSPLHHRALREILRAFVVAASVLLASSAVSAGMRTSLSAPGHEKITVRLKTIPARLVAGKPATLFISITGPEGKPVQGLTVMHERIMHVIITGQDFSRFAHIHPEDFERLTPGVIKKAGFRLRYAFPEGGRYAVGTSFAVRGRMVSRHFILEVSGRPEMGPPKTDLSREKRFDGYEVTLTPTGTIRAGKETSFRYLIHKNGKPAADLGPYLGAPMHIAIISDDLKYFAHIHGELPGETMPPMGKDEEEGMRMTPQKFGPEIDFHMLFPAKGVYQIFGQFKGGGKVVLTSFMVEAR